MSQNRSDLKLEFSTRLLLLQHQLEQGLLAGDSVYEFLRLFMIGASVAQKHVGMRIICAFITVQKQLRKSLGNYNAQSGKPVKLQPRVVQQCGQLVGTVVKLLDATVTELELADSAIAVTEAIYGPPSTTC